MSLHTCSSIVVTCIDFRFQKYIEDWVNKKVGVKEYDRVALAGGVFDAFAVIKQIEISNRLHSIKKVILANHEDCGAYGKDGTPERHQKDLSDTAQKIKQLFPHLIVESYYIHLDGKFEKTS